MKTGIAALIVATGTAFAGTTDIVITELWSGLSGEDGTPDWIEVTWYGAGTLDTGTLIFDDENPTVASGGMLDSFILNSGESAVFLLDHEPADDATYATALEEFAAIWGSVANVGLTNGGGNLSQNGDQANILNAAGDVLASLTFDSNLGGDPVTIENLNGVIRQSVAGENGAYASAEFFNDNGAFGSETTGSLIGSPGAIPAPAGLAVLGLGGLVSARRRRA